MYERSRVPISEGGGGVVSRRGIVGAGVGAYIKQQTKEKQ